MPHKERLQQREQLPSTELVELIKKNHTQIIKRAKRILNPLDDHPFLDMESGTLPVTQTGEATMGRLSYFSPQSAVEHFTTAVASSERDPKLYGREIERESEEGYDLLKAIAEQSSEEIRSQSSLFEGLTHNTPLKGWVNNPDIHAVTSLLSYVCRDELFKAKRRCPSNRFWRLI